MLISVLVHNELPHDTIPCCKDNAAATVLVKEINISSLESFYQQKDERSEPPGLSENYVMYKQIKPHFKHSKGSSILKNRSFKTSDKLQT